MGPTATRPSALPDAGALRAPHLHERERVRFLERFEQALQDVIDAVARLERFECLIPEVLTIAGRAFGTITCAYYEHASDVVRLVYWNSRGRVYGPSELPDVPEAQARIVAQLAAGFTVPEDYLGTTVRGRTRAVVIDHGRGTPVPEFDAFAVAMGWELELNVPIVVNGAADGALVLYRGAEVPFGLEEITLAETLAKQISFALQARRLALAAQERAAEATAALERERASRERAAELARANAALRRSIDGIAQSSPREDFLAEMLAATMDLAGAQGGAVVLARGDVAEHVVLMEHGRRVPRETQEREGTYVVPIPPKLRESMLRARVEGEVWNAPPGDGTHPPAFVEYHRARGNKAVRLLPFVAQGRVMGWMGLGFATADPRVSDRLDLLRVLAEQVTVAIRLYQLADEAEAAAISHERNRMAREIHDTLAQSFTGIFLQLEAAGELAASKPDLARVCIARAEKLAREGLREARRSVLSLEPDALVYRDLATALRRLTQSTLGTGLRAELEISGEPRVVSPDLGLNLLRIAQEALGNAQRYSGADEVRIRLGFLADEVSLEVSDRGRGFRLEDSLPQAGHGLANMRHRAERVGARLEVETGEGRGTTVRLCASSPEPEKEAKR